MRSPFIAPRKRGWLRNHADGLSVEVALDTIGVWVVAALENATDLLADGDALYDAGRYVRAASMAHFALEEMGKCMLLISLLTDMALDEKTDWAWYENAISGHTDKFHLINWAVTLGQDEEQVSVVERWLEFAYRDSHRPLREMSLYVDFVDGEVQRPRDAIDKDEAHGYLGTGFSSGLYLIDFVRGLSDRVRTISRLPPEEKERLRAKRQAFVKRHAEERREVMRMMKEKGLLPQDPKEGVTPRRSN